MSPALCDVMLLHDGVVEVIVELKTTAAMPFARTRQEGVQRARELFEDEAASLKARIASCGARS
jgi:hypothetical protein